MPPSLTSNADTRAHYETQGRSVFNSLGSTVTSLQQRPAMARTRAGAGAAPAARDTAMAYCAGGFAGFVAGALAAGDCGGSCAFIGMAVEQRCWNSALVLVN